MDKSVMDRSKATPMSRGGVEMPEMKSDNNASKGDEAARASKSKQKEIDNGPAPYADSCLQPIWTIKAAAKVIILDSNTQLFIAGVIFLNFLTTAISVTQAAMDDPGLVDVCETLDWIFVMIFLVELALNMFAHCNAKGEDIIMDPFPWRWEFFVGDNMGWNIFDLIIIVVPLIAAATWATSIRAFRLFRVIRIIRTIAKIDALVVVSQSIARSMSGIYSLAVMMMGIIACYSIIGVNFFGQHDFGAACSSAVAPLGHEGPMWTDPTLPGVDTEAHLCANYEMLYEAFQNLRYAMYQCFMMMTLESWPDLCWASLYIYKGAAIYFVSYVMLAALMLTNLIFAIFTTKMDQVADEVKEAASKRASERNQERTRTMRTMSSFVGAFSEKTEAMQVDVDGDGKADFYDIDVDGDGIVDHRVTAEEYQDILSKSPKSPKPREVKGFQVGKGGKDADDDENAYEDMSERSSGDFVPMTSGEGSKGAYPKMPTPTSKGQEGGKTSTKKGKVMESFAGWKEGEAVEVYSQHLRKWCLGSVSRVDVEKDRITVTYNVDGNMTGETTFPRIHKYLRRPLPSQNNLAAVNTEKITQLLLQLSRVAAKVDGLINATEKMGIKVQIKTGGKNNRQGSVKTQM